MKKRRTIAGTVLAATALCWALLDGTAKVDAIYTRGNGKNTVSAPCTPQGQPTESINNIVIEEPVTESETVPVAGSVDSPTQECPQETPEPTNSEPITIAT